MSEEELKRRAWEAVPEEVLIALQSEREYQDRLWNADTTPTEGIHSVGEWLVFMQDYMTEAMKQISRQGEPKASEDALHTIRKITMMGVRCMEQNGAPIRSPVS